MKALLKVWISPAGLKSYIVVSAISLLEWRFRIVSATEEILH